MGGEWAKVVLLPQLAAREHVEEERWRLASTANAQAEVPDDVNADLLGTPLQALELPERLPRVVEAAAELLAGG